MKIVFVSQPLATGGTKRVVAALANRFYELGHEVKIIIVDNGEENSYFTYDEIEIISIAKPHNPVLDFLYRAKEIRHYLKRYKPDIVLPFATQKNVSVLFAMLFTDQKIIISERNNPFRDPRSRYLRILRKLLYFTSDGFVFQTEEAKNFFSKGIQRRSCVIANPVNLSLPDVWPGKREPRIVMVNRLDIQKNIKMGIVAFAHLIKKYPQYRLEIYGRGPLESELKEYISKKKLTGKVILKGFCSNVTEQIQNAEIFMLTSDYEGMSNSLMEAMALGLVCISTDDSNGGAKSIIKDGENGVLIPVRNTKACIYALNKVVESEEFREKLSRNAVKIRNDLSIGNVAIQWLEYIKKIVYGTRWYDGIE